MTAPPVPAMTAAPVQLVPPSVPETSVELANAAPAPVDQTVVATPPEQAVPGPDLITSSTEPRTKKERQRKEREVSMAELARDIIAISEQEPGSLSSNGHGAETEGEGSTADETGRHASFDMVIGPAPRGGRLRRKIPTPKDAAEELADLAADSGLETGVEAGGDKGRMRSRLRHR
jgi:hypothetical protein